MAFERMSQESKKTLELSMREALNFGSNQIRPEHLLLALTHQEDTEACRVLQALGVTTIAVRRELHVNEANQSLADLLRRAADELDAK